MNQDETDRLIAWSKACGIHGSRQKVTGPQLSPCIHLGRPHHTIPASHINCGCGIVRILECGYHDDLTIERPVNADAWEFLTRPEQGVKRCCVGCGERNRRKHHPVGNVVLSDTGLGDVTLNCWYPQAQLNVPPDRVDVVKLFGGTLTTKPGENLAESWQPELRSREPRIDFRARWYGVTEIRRPQVHLDPAAVFWAKGLRQDGKPLVLFTPLSAQRERTWPIEHWQALCGILAASGISVLIDVPSDAPWLHGPRWLPLVGQSVQRLAATIGEADLTISSDTGPAHVAGTMDRQTLVLMGPTIPNSYEHMPSVQILRSGRACTGCNFQLPNYQSSCFAGCHSLKELTPEAVAARTLRMLTPTKIGVCSLATDEIADVREITRPTLEAYCQRHGYPLHYWTEKRNGRPASWSKILMLQQYLADHEWLWWADADLAVTAPERRLEELTDGATGDTLIAEDHNGINNGSFLVRRCDWTADFLRRVWDTIEPHDHMWWEQWAMMRLLDSNPADRAHVQFVRKRSLNSYPSDWRPGDFVLHTPGTPDRVRVLREAVESLTPAQRSS